jgi:Ala-tRNA(Pro) deacylase
MDFEQYLKQNGVQYEKHAHSIAYTAQGLAQAEHVSGYMVAKPVIVKAGGDYVMCVLPAPRRVDLKRVADALNEKQVRLADETEMSKLFSGCELGAEPPLGAMFGLRTIMDERLKQDESLVMQAGSHTQAVKLRREDWERLCMPVVAPIAAD